MQLCEDEAQFDEGETVGEEGSVSFGLGDHGSEEKGYVDGGGGVGLGERGGSSVCVCVCEGKSDGKKREQRSGKGRKYFRPRQTLGPR